LRAHGLDRALLRKIKRPKTAALLTYEVWRHLGQILVGTSWP